MSSNKPSVVEMIPVLNTPKMSAPSGERVKMSLPVKGKTPPRSQLENDSENVDPKRAKLGGESSGDLPKKLRSFLPSTKDDRSKIFPQNVAKAKVLNVLKNIDNKLLELSTARSVEKSGMHNIRKSLAEMESELDSPLEQQLFPEADMINEDFLEEKYSLEKDLELDDFPKLLEKFSKFMSVPEVPGFHSLYAPLKPKSSEDYDPALWIRKFTRPIPDNDLPTEECPIKVDQAFVDSYRQFIVAVFVKNYAFEKRITCRWSCDGWKTTKEFVLTHVSTMTCEDLDLFRGTVKIPRDATCVEFAVRFQVNEREYWDNNEGDNYYIERIEKIGEKSL